MLRAVLLVLFVSGALAGCERTAPKPAPVAQPAIADATPPADPAPMPSVPTDIAKAPARRKPAPAKPVDDNGSPDPGAMDDDPNGPDPYAEYDIDNGVPHDSDPEMDQERPQHPIASSWGGVGDVEFGMEVDEVRDVWPGDLEGHDSDECFYLTAQMDRPSVAPALMFEEGRLVRYDVDTPGLQAPGGGRVGMDADEIFDRYGGDVERLPHKYTDGEYLRIENGDRVLLFETDGEGVVTEWRVGVPPQVDYVEGCS